MLSPKEELYEWLVDNFEEVAQDLFADIAEEHAEENGWDIVEVHFMIDEMVEKIREGILNVVDTMAKEE